MKNQAAPQAVRLCFARLGHLLGVDEMPGAPVALDEPPGAGHVDRVPGVAEPVVLELDPGLVAGGLAVALDHDAVQPGVAGDTRMVRERRKCLQADFSHCCCFIVYCLKYLHLLDQLKMMKTFNFTLQSGKDEGCANINNPDKWGIITSHSSNDHLSSLATLFSLALC